MFNGERLQVCTSFPKDEARIYIDNNSLKKSTFHEIPLPAEEANMRSIQTKFIALTLGCTLLAALIIGGAGILSAKRTVDADSAKMMNLLCAEKAQELDGLLSRIQQSVKTLAIYTISQLESVDRLKNDPAYLKSFTHKLETIAVNAASNTEGAMAVYVRFNPTLTPPTSGLFWSKTTLDGSFHQLTPTDFSSFAPTDVEHVGWYYIPIKKGKATWMNPYFNKNLNVEMISYVIPLYMNNQTVGVVGMDIDFSVITDIVKRMSLYQSGYAFMLDNSANVTFHHELKQGTSLTESDTSLRPLLMEMRSGSSGNMLFPYFWRSEEKKMAFRPLSNGMRLICTAPVAEIDAAKNELVTLVSVAVLVISCLAVLLTVYMTHRLTRPLRELNDAAKKIAAGDLSVNLTQQTKDEVGSLADSFQQTVEHLQKYINYINGLAYRDSLTGVKNKTAYLEAEAQFEEKMRTGKPEFALVVMDINGLKKINDTCGHDFGDILIINACRIICKTFHHSPVYRIGGDEFVAILETIDYKNYRELLQKFEDEIAMHNKSAHQDCYISIARGIAIYNSQIDLVFANVFKRADEAMYQNKAAMKALAAAEQAGGQEPDKTAD